MPLIVNDVVEVTINMSLQGRSSQNVTHWRCDRPITGNSESVAQRVLESWQDNIMTPLASDVAVIGADYVDLDSDQGDTGSVAPNPAKPLVGGGLRSGDAGEHLHPGQEGHRGGTSQQGRSHVRHGWD